MARYFYAASIPSFLSDSEESILGQLTISNTFALETTQRDAWIEEVRLLKKELSGFAGKVFLEYSIPRLGARIDAVLVIEGVVFVIEFKVGERTFPRHAIDQVWDYSLDLRNFHEPSHDRPVLPILICTDAPEQDCRNASTRTTSEVGAPQCLSATGLRQVITATLDKFRVSPLDPEEWERGRYCPTPTIVEAAMALYRGHTVEEISRNDAGAAHLATTSNAIDKIIADSRSRSEKAICFVTGVPGSGKTLVGLNIATKHFSRASDSYSVFLSGNGPLVEVLREALTRDKLAHDKLMGAHTRKKEIMSEVKTFVQNVHHFRDECLNDEKAPVEHVALFDEAQRAWNAQMTSDFMRRKKRRPGFEMSEPEFLISCLDRHRDWAVVVCLVGGGQEINTGEAGIGEWFCAMQESFPDWMVYVSPNLTDSEYDAESTLAQLAPSRVHYIEDLHLSTSMRSFRAESVSLLVKQILDMDVEGARSNLRHLNGKYPIYLTRDLKRAKEWLRSQSKGTERFGMMVSSQAERLRPHAIDVRPKINPIHWFLNGKEDVRSSYYLEDVATEFHIQGLEVDWGCVVWDADFRPQRDGWDHWSFKGERWERIRAEDRRKYQKNAYRVLLTRSRQGMVIVVPKGSDSDPTRDHQFYDPTFEYLRSLGLPLLT